MPRFEKTRDRRGLATSECAIVLPIIFMIMFGTIELCSVIFVKEALTVAAYEAGRVAVQRRSTSAAAEAVGETVLDDRGISTGTDPISISPDPSTAAIMTALTVTATAPISGNTYVPSSVYQFFGYPEVSATVVMRKEFSDD